jgi:hypothetical protein
MSPTDTEGRRGKILFGKSTGKRDQILLRKKKPENPVE